MKTPKPKSKYMEKQAKTAKPAAKRKTAVGPRMSTALLANTIQKTRPEQHKALDLLHDNQSTHRQLKLANLDEVGANLSASGWRALIAIARVAGLGGQYNEADTQRKNNQIVAPSDILITRRQFFNAYGLKRKPNSRAVMDFASSETAWAIQGLNELTLPVVQIYKRKAVSGKAGRFDVVRSVAPLVTYDVIKLDATTQQVQALEAGDINGAGVKHIRIRPSEIFYLSSFMSLPDHLYQKLEELEGKRALTPTLYKQVILLALHHHHDPENKTFRRQLDKFLANTGKNKMLESRQRNRAIKETSKELDKLKKAGAVTEHRIINDERNGKFIEVDIVPEAFE